ERSLVELVFHLPQDANPATTEHGTGLPPNIVLQQSGGFQRRLAPQVRERGQALVRPTAEQVAPVHVELLTCEQNARRQASQESQGSHDIGAPGHIISLRAARACAMVTPS